MKPRVIVIVGPTASGKSDLAVKMAKKMNGEVISADSRQVYKGLDIGSGKITKKEMKGVVHYMLDVANPKKTFTVDQYQKMASKCIDEIISRGKTPIICGGTGFYIQSIVDGIIFPDVPRNLKLREKLDKKSSAEIFKILKKLDPARAKDVDHRNRPRIIRAIEIATALGKVPSFTKSKKPNTSTPSDKYEFIKIGLKPTDEILKKRIEKRLHSRLKIGMIKEVENLHKKGLSWKRLEELGLEYRYIAEFLQKKITRDQMIEQIKLKSWQYAKRQMTWFKRDKEIIWQE